jgi:hypothetical protein
LLNEVVIQQAMFESVDRTASLGRQFLESTPDEQGAAEGVARDACLAAPATFQARELLALPGGHCSIFQRTPHPSWVAAVES